MANVNKASGLMPVRYLSGAPYTGKVRTYVILSTDNNAFAIGDPLDLAGTGDDNGVPAVTLATAGTGNPLVGSLVTGAGGLVYGADFGIPQETPIVIPATKTRNYYVGVCDDPNVIFIAQEVSGGTQLTKAEIGLNANLSSGANNGYVSVWQINNSGEAVTDTLQVKLLGLAQMTDNAFGAYAKWEVLINNHRYRYGIAGV